MRRHLLGLLLVGLSVASACEAPTDATNPTVSQAAYESLLASPSLTRSPELDSSFAVEYRPYRFRSGFANRGARVARSADTWTPLFDTLQRGSPPSPPLAIDFAQEMVILALYGEEQTGGHVVRIRHVTLTRDTLFVLAERSRPGANCVVTQAFTHPTDARIVPTRRAPVIVLFAPFVHDCETGRNRPDW